MEINLPSREAAGFRGMVARRPLTAFLAVFLFVIWPVAWLLPLSAHGIVPWGNIEWILSPLIILFFGFIVAIIWAEEGWPGARRFLARVVRWRFGLGWWIAIFAGLPALGILFNLAMGATLHTQDLGNVVLRQAWAAIAGMLTTNLWEESVWAGFFQTRLERSWRILPAAWLTAIPFVIIHIPAQFVGDFSFGGVAVGITALLIFAGLFRPMMAFAMRGTDDSLLAVGLFHAVFNITSPGNGLVATLTPGVDPVLATLAATILMTVGMGIAVRKKLSRAYRLEVLERDRQCLTGN